MLSDYRDAGRALQTARQVLVITGAGISAESGIPTFRGAGGFWGTHDPMKLATWEGFVEDPQAVWEWYDARRDSIAKASPNAAHLALAELERLGKQVFVLTQNVDDLHERANSREIAHIHGSIWHVTCLKELRTYENRQVPLPVIPPVCECGGRLRPAIVWFGEYLPLDVVKRIERRYETHRPDILIVVGTEASFDYILQYVQLGKDLGAPVIEINPVSTAVTPMADYVFQEKATVALSRLMHEVDLR